jgi:hypothetical protein
MKILLREYNYRQYVWVQAKYDKNHFIVNGERQYETNVVSVINDNRKNYIQCSCCGKVFRKGDHRFEIHKQQAASPTTCFDCPHLNAHRERTIKREYVMNSDGTYTRKTEQSVELQCSSGYMWSYPNIDSVLAISNCKLRQCGNATEREIEDIFTQHPGVFDDIITIDRVLDMGYIGLPEPSLDYNSYTLDVAYDIKAFVNPLNIVDYFTITLEGYTYVVWYSKKYNEILTNNEDGHYTAWVCKGLSVRQRTEIKEIFAKLYR